MVGRPFVRLQMPLLADPLLLLSQGPGAVAGYTADSVSLSSTPWPYGIVGPRIIGILSSMGWPTVLQEVYREPGNETAGDKTGTQTGLVTIVEDPTPTGSVVQATTGARSGMSIWVAVTLASLWIVIVA